MPYTPVERAGDTSAHQRALLGYKRTDDRERARGDRGQLREVWRERGELADTSRRSRSASRRFAAREQLPDADPDRRRAHGDGGEREARSGRPRSSSPRPTARQRRHPHRADRAAGVCHAESRRARRCSARRSAWSRSRITKRCPARDLRRRKAGRTARTRASSRRSRSTRSRHACRQARTPTRTRRPTTRRSRRRARGPTCPLRCRRSSIPSRASRTTSRRSATFPGSRATEYPCDRGRAPFPDGLAGRCAQHRRRPARNRLEGPGRRRSRGREGERRSRATALRGPGRSRARGRDRFRACLAGEDDRSWQGWITTRRSGGWPARPRAERNVDERPRHECAATEARGGARKTERSRAVPRAREPRQPRGRARRGRGRQ